MKSHLPVLFSLYIISVTYLAHHSTCGKAFEYGRVNIPMQILSPLPEVTGIIFEHLLCNLPLSSFTVPLSCSVSLYVAWSPCEGVTVRDGRFFSMQETLGELPVFL